MQVFFRGNCSICICRVSVSVGGGEFRLFLCHHLKLEPSCMIILKVYFSMTLNTGESRSRKGSCPSKEGWETQTVYVSSNYLHTNCGSHSALYVPRSHATVKGGMAAGIPEAALMSWGHESCSLPGCAPEVHARQGLQGLLLSRDPASAAPLSFTLN